MAPIHREVEDEEVRKIRIAKMEEIRKAWDDLFFILAGEELFKKNPLVSDYSSFEKTMRQALADARQKHLKKSGSTETGQTKPFEVSLNKELLSVDYTPPQELMDIPLHLIDLYVYYRSNSFTPSIEMALDLSLCKLLVAVKTLCAITSLKGSRELTRTKTSTKAKKEQTDKRKEFIIAIYEHGKGIEAGTKFYRACTIIRKQFENSRGSKGPWGTIPMDPKEMPTPSIDTIERC